MDLLRNRKLERRLRSIARLTPDELASLPWDVLMDLQEKLNSFLPDTGGGLMEKDDLTAIVGECKYEWMAHSSVIVQGLTAEQMWKDGWEMEGGAWCRPRRKEEEK